MRFFWLLFCSTAFCLLILLADALADMNDCPQMDNSSVYDESGRLVCKDGWKV